MKNIFIVLLLLIFSVQTFAQNKPQKNTLGIGLDYNLRSSSSFPALRFDYYLSNLHSLNFIYRPGFVLRNDKSNRPSYSALGTIENIYKQTGYFMEIGLGYETHFLPKSKFDPFVGLNASYYYSAKGNRYSLSTNEYQLSPNGIEFKTVSESNLKGIENHGIKASLIGGLNYFIVKNFSLGASFNVGYQYLNSNGKTIESGTRKQYENDVLVNDEPIENLDERNYISNNFIYNVSIKAAYYFNFTKKKE